MKKFILGKTGIEVTELCFGALPIGYLQKNVLAEQAGQIIARALLGGITFIDTAEIYKTYEPIRIALELTGLHPVIASKSYASGYNEMCDTVFAAKEAMNLEYIDIFHLHCARPGKEVYKDRKDALKALCDLKEKGIIKATGISGHNTQTIRAAADIEEIDVVFPLINYTGIGIIGTQEEMEEAIRKCSAARKGIYLMKIFGGGTLINNFERCISYARALGNFPIAMGMISSEELDYNLRYFNAENPSSIPAPDFKTFSKHYNILVHQCANCGNCIKTCPNGAIEQRWAHPFIVTEKCLTCGYCVEKCKSFAIRAY